jgi:colanic acid/amylovoran biosynthesis glycosyltransferase
MNRPPNEMQKSRRTVAIFCNTFLPYSQTFIWDEIRSHERYAVEVFAWRRRNVNLFPGPVRVARPWYPLTCRDGGFERRFSLGGIDLVHAHFGWAGAHAAGFARRHALPLVITFHGYDVALLARRAPGPPTVWPYTLRAQSMLESMDLGLCASAELLEMVAALGVPRSRLIEHRLGVDLERFRPQTRDDTVFRVAMVGRLVEKKGFSDGIEAFAMFARRASGRPLLSVAGSGPLEGELRSRAASLGIGTLVHFAGELSHSEIAGLLARSDVLLAPSRVAADGDRDSGLLSAKEASACECVPIATRHGGIPSIIDDGVTGFLVDERNVEAVADRLADLASDLSLRRVMGRAAREKMLREFELHASVRQLEEHYDEVMRRHTPSDRLLDAGVEHRPSSQ